MCLSRHCIYCRNDSLFYCVGYEMRGEVKGWFEEYECGCTSETVRYKKDLLGYCGFHGTDRRHIYPDMDMTPMNQSNSEAGEKKEREK